MYAKDELLENPDFLISALTEYKKLKDERTEIKRLNEELLETTQSSIENSKELLEIVNFFSSEIEKSKPQIDYVNEILDSDLTMTITQIAADYGMTGHKLNKILEEEKIQRKINGQWVLYKKYQDYDFVDSSTVRIYNKNGDGVKTVINTKWTQKGRMFIHMILVDKEYALNDEYNLIDTQDNSHNLLEEHKNFAYNDEFASSNFDESHKYEKFERICEEFFKQKFL